MILANTEEEEAEALDELRVVQQADFEEILEAMDGLPVTVRLLDPPLHEFLPSIEELRIKEAVVGPVRGREGDAPRRRELGRAQPDDRHPRCAARRDQARAVRDAGAGAARRGDEAARRRWQSRSSRS